MKFYKQLNDQQVEVTKTDLTEEQYKFMKNLTCYVVVDKYIAGIDGSTIPLFIEQVRLMMERRLRNYPLEGFVVSDEDLTDLITEYGDLEYRIDVDGNHTMSFNHSIPLLKEEVEELDLEELAQRTTLDEFNLRSDEVCGYDTVDSECSGEVVTTLRINYPSVDWS